MIQQEKPSIERIENPGVGGNDVVTAAWCVQIVIHVHTIARTSACELSRRYADWLEKKFAADNIIEVSVNVDCVNSLKEGNP